MAVPATRQMVQCRAIAAVGARGQLITDAAQPHLLRQTSSPGHVGVGPHALGGEHRVKTRILGHDAPHTSKGGLRAPIPQL